MNTTAVKHNYTDGYQTAAIMAKGTYILQCSCVGHTGKCDITRPDNFRWTVTFQSTLLDKFSTLHSTHMKAQKYEPQPTDLQAALNNYWQSF